MLCMCFYYLKIQGVMLSNQFQFGMKNFDNFNKDVESLFILNYTKSKHIYNTIVA